MIICTTSQRRLKDAHKQAQQQPPAVTARALRTVRYSWLWYNHRMRRSPLALVTLIMCGPITNIRPARS
jgi:hypothetical protein